MSNAQHDEIEITLQKADDFMSNAIEKLNKDEEVDLTGMDAMVAELCEKVVTLPEDKAKAFHEKLQKLMEKLNTVAALLQKQHEAIKGQISGLNEQKQAAVAYGKAGGLHDKPEDKGE